MIKKQTVIVIYFLFLNVGLHKIVAQSSIDNTRFNMAMNQLSTSGTGAGSVIYQFASPDDLAKILGDTYHDIHWAKSSILLWDGKLFNGHLARYDIKKSEFDVKTQNGIGIITADRVKNFVWIDSVSGHPRTLVNTREYFSNGKPFEGMSELLVEGKFSVFKKILLDITPPTFNSAMNIGNKDYVITKKVKFYYSMENNVHELKKKQAIKSLKVIQPDLENFCAKESINWSQEDDIVKLFKYLNSN